MIFLLRDDFFGEERLAALRASLGSPDVQNLNISVLDGARLTVGELRGVAEALPFLSDKRLIVVRRLFGGAGSAQRSDASTDGASPRRGRAGSSEREQEFLAYFPEIPPFTDLALVEEHEFSAQHRVVKVVQQLGGEIHLEGAPRGEELSRWIERRVRAKEGQIERAARESLAALPSIDLRQLDLILDSLVTYAGEHAISVADVRTIVQASRDEVDVFDLVDAVGTRDRRAALGAFRRLLIDNVSPIYVMVMLARQIRLLLLAQEALNRREDVAAALKLHPRVAQKIVQQARAFGSDRCLDAYRRLVETDDGIKTGQIEEQAAIEMLIVALTER